MTVGFYSPLPPARSGVADYAASLLRELRKHGDVAVAPENCDLALYQMGNNLLHREVYERAVRHPGVVVLHDAVLHHFYLGSLAQAQYQTEFAYNYGEWAQHEARALWRDRSLSAQDPRYFERPMLKRIAETARTVVVHNPAAAMAVRSHAPSAEIVEIPHFHESRSVAVSPHAGFTFGVFGYLRHTKRLFSILGAFQRLYRLNPNTQLIVSGECGSHDFARALHAPLSQPGVTRLPHLGSAEFDNALASVDCCVNLRYPQAGETSGIAMRAMGAGKPVIVTEGAEWSRFPEGSLLPIPSGPGEIQSLFEAMALLSDNLPLAKHMGRVAAGHIQRYHSLSASGNEYWNLLCRLHASSS